MTKDTYPKLDLEHELQELEWLRLNLVHGRKGTGEKPKTHDAVTTLARIAHFALRKISDSYTNPARLEIIVNEDDPGLDGDVAPRPTTTKVLTVAEYRLASMIAQLEPLTTQEAELTCAIESLRSAHRRICRIITDNEE